MFTSNGSRDSQFERFLLRSLVTAASVEDESVPTQPSSGRLSSFLLRIPVPWVYVLAYLAGAGLEKLLPLTLSSALPSSTFIAGAIFFAVGAIIAGWSWAIFHRLGTSRVPGEASSTLVTWGPFRFSRNPMYVGLAIAYVGEAGMLRQVWPVLLLPLVLMYLNWTVIPLEESRLQEVFKAGYDQYRQRTRRWF
jgi:protein-S-isoprenylcysteine O-methyltransferase Ste14